MGRLLTRAARTKELKAQTDYNEGAASQPYATKSDRGLSSLHLAHNWVVNGIWTLPSPARSGFASYLLGGWQFSGIYSASSGAPFTTYVNGRNAPDLTRNAGRQHPDIVAGRNNSNIVSGTTAGCSFSGGTLVPYNGTAGVTPGQKLGTPDLYFDPCAFFLPPAGFYGNAGRNFLIGPGFSNVDFSLLKNTHVGIHEGSRLEFHADFFNLFNRANFGPPTGTPGTQTLNAANRQPVAGAGLLTKVVGRERQVQFGLKLIF
ncbi:MAG: hypothetical protein A3J28_09925 [Acidobacteria bacterium RIFCSPLOWO2_12_FULL_60_22]|nr:MAG: hypothetical protein A3J28_09925 [Acidobacteria bacterium RIFCSPLOWO2_12_FULL_60_22]